MNQSIDIDEEKLDRMKYKILQAENDNNKTKDLTPGQMVAKIKKIIINEASRKM